MDKKSQRPLLPASRILSPNSLKVTKPNLKRKRSQITRVACETCRAKKSACDGSRPSCTSCQIRSSQCVYTSVDELETPTMVLKRENEALRRRSETLEELVKHMVCMPEDIAQVILWRLRTTSNPLLVLQSIRGETLSDQLSEQATARGILPLVQSGLEFELMVRHPVSYPTLDPLKDNSLLKSPLLIPANLLVMSLSPDLENPQGNFLTQQIFDSCDASSGSEEHITQFEPIRHESTDGDLPENVAQQAHCYFNPQLNGLSIAFWTAVPVTNQYAASVISLYLETDHPLLGLFDSQLFVGNLVDCRLEFCSPFLVSALLSFASQAYASKDPEASARSYEFESEAEKLWLDEGMSDSSTTIVGLLFLFLSLECHGQGEMATKHINAVFKMAVRMKLFGVEDTLSARDLGSLSEEDQRTIAHATWGAFNIVVMQTLFHFAPTIKYPPTLPIPGNCENIGAEDEETEIQLPLPAEMGQTFPSFCILWTTVSEILLVYRNTESQQKISLTFALSKYYKLLSWADTLPHSMARSEYNPAHVVVFHIWYHATILDIFRPFISNRKQHDLESWSPSSTSPEAIFTASLKQLKRLILVYKGRYRSAAYSIFWNAALLYVANAVLKDRNDPEWRFYFQMCIHSYQGLYPSFRAVEAIAQGLLAMAIDSGAITNLEAILMIQMFRENGNWHKLADRPRGGYVLDLGLAITDHNAARVDNLVDRFEEITLFSEFTDGIA